MSPTWLAWKRPILTTLLFSCGISLLTESRLSLHLVGSTAIYWTFLPLCGLLGLAAVHRGWPDPAFMDRFFLTYRPWLLFVIAFAAVGSSPEGTLMTPASFTFWEIYACFTLLWSCWIDYHFFGSAQSLAIQRVFSWGPFIAIFAGSWVWQETAQALGL